MFNVMKPKLMFAIKTTVEILLQAAKETNCKTRIIVFEKYPGLECLEDLLQQQNAGEIDNFQPIQIKDPMKTAMVLFSSGTTGMPKGVQIPCHSLGRNLKKFLALENSEVIMCYSSLYWISGTYNMIQGILTSSTRVLQSFNPDEVCKVIQKYKVDVYNNWQNVHCYIHTSLYIRVTVI